MGETLGKPRMSFGVGGHHSPQAINQDVLSGCGGKGRRWDSLVTSR